ncbi:hypothetical protein AB0I76_29165, partial [Micromonospora sp. NPDC049799]
AQQELADLRQETWKSRQESDELQRQVAEVRLELTGDGRRSSGTDGTGVLPGVPVTTAKVGASAADGNGAKTGSRDTGKSGSATAGSGDTGKAGSAEVQPADEGQQKATITTVTTLDGGGAGTGENGNRPAKPTTDERGAKPSKVAVDKD